MSPRDLVRSLPRPLRLAIEGILPAPALAAVRDAISEFIYEPRGWPRRESDESSPSSAEYVKHWAVLVENLEGSGPLGVSHLPGQVTRDNRASHNTMMSYGYVLARAAQNREKMSILDWGASLGHYYLYSKALLPEITLDYHCFEVPALCQAGRRLLPEVQFHEGADHLAGAFFDLVISSSTLHYFEDWRETARVLAARTGGLLYVARLMVVHRVPTFVVKQRVYDQTPPREIMSWFINREELLKHFDSLGMDLIREFVFSENWRPKKAPEKGDCRGFLFRPR